MSSDRQFSMRHALCIAGVVLVFAGIAGVHAKDADRFYVAFSLRTAHEEVLRCNASSAPYPAAVTGLDGITWLAGVVADEDNNDLVLVGERIAGRPALRMDDLVVALGNSWLQYSPFKNGKYSYSYPSCSIDPDTQTLRRLRSVARSIQECPFDSLVEILVSKYQAICRSNQRVSVWGVPRRTHFAKVMVDADYDMKNIVNGVGPSGVEGLVSLAQMQVDDARDRVVGGNVSLAMYTLINRFWFYPGKNKYAESYGIITIRTCPVTLVTEEQFMTPDGRNVSAGRADPLAQRFADQLSGMYGKLSQRNPVYVELENLFRFFAAAQMMNSRSLDRRTGFDMRAFIRDFRIPDAEVDTVLAGRSGFMATSEKVETSEGRATFKVRMPCCGGVGMNIEPKEEEVARDTGIAVIRSAVLKARPAKRKLSWTIPVPSGE